MTKSWEKGENEYTRAAGREALLTGASTEEILKRMLEEARQAKDKQGMIKIRRAQKYYVDRNRRKRRRRR